MKSRDVPTQLDNPNFDRLKEVCSEYMESVSEGDYIDDDLIHYIFETAIEAFYGKDIWGFVNEEE